MPKQKIDNGRRNFLQETHLHAIHAAHDNHRHTHGSLSCGLCRPQKTEATNYRSRINLASLNQESDSPSRGLHAKQVLENDDVCKSFLA